MIKDGIKILLVEDTRSDVILITHQIKKVVENPKIVQVYTIPDFLESLDHFKPDIILSDYQLNSFTGLDTLAHAKQKAPNLPFIFVTDTMNNEELAANTILNGASGFILKKNIQELHSKLLPYFETIVEKKKAGNLPPGHREILDGIQEFLQGVKSENAAHRENYLEIKKDLERYKKSQK